MTFPLTLGLTSYETLQRFHEWAAEHDVRYRITGFYPCYQIVFENVAGATMFKMFWPDIV